MEGVDRNFGDEGNASIPEAKLVDRLEEAGYVAVVKTYRGKIPQALLHLTDAGRTACEEYRRELKRALQGAPL